MVAAYAVAVATAFGAVFVADASIDAFGVFGVFAAFVALVLALQSVFVMLSV